jgi:hypothetical protein
VTWVGRSQKSGRWASGAVRMRAGSSGSNRSDQSARTEKHGHGVLVMVRESGAGWLNCGTDSVDYCPYPAGDQDPQRAERHRGGHVDGEQITAVVAAVVSGVAAGLAIRQARVARDSADAAEAGECGGATGIPDAPPDRAGGRRREERGPPYAVGEAYWLSSAAGLPVGLLNARRT